MTSDKSRIWVVDDDRSVRFVLAEALRDAGYRVLAFDGAKPALDALQTEKLPALVFTDVRMPGMDGLAFLDALKAAQPELPVRGQALGRVTPGQARELDDQVRLGRGAQQKLRRLVVELHVGAQHRRGQGGI